jgi:hypothetical protein
MLYHIYCNETEICVESTTPNRTDTEGGYFTHSPTDGKVRLVEISEMPGDKREEFKRRHKFFNTNNIWVNLRSLKKLMDTTGILSSFIFSHCIRYPRQNQCLGWCHFYLNSNFSCFLLRSERQRLDCLFCNLRLLWAPW